MYGTLCLKRSHEEKYFLSPLGFLFVCRLEVSSCCEGVVKIGSTYEAQGRTTLGLYFMDYIQDLMA